MKSPTDSEPLLCCGKSDALMNELFTHILKTTKLLRQSPFSNFQDPKQRAQWDHQNTRLRTWGDRFGLPHTGLGRALFPLDKPNVIKNLKPAFVLSLGILAALLCSYLHPENEETRKELETLLENGSREVPECKKIVVRSTIEAKNDESNNETTGGTETGAPEVGIEIETVLEQIKEAIDDLFDLCHFLESPIEFSGSPPPTPSSEDNEELSQSNLTHESLPDFEQPPLDILATNNQPEKANARKAEPESDKECEAIYPAISQWSGDTCSEDPRIASEDACESEESTYSNISHFYRTNILDKFPLLFNNPSLLNRLAKHNRQRHIKIRKAAATNDQQMKSLTKNDCGTLHDSGLGQSLLTDEERKLNYLAGTKSVTSATSFGTTHSTASGRTLIPNPPVELGPEVEFQCNICFGLVKNLHNTRDWKKHVLQDIEPYTCLFESCPQGQVRFSNRQSWISHEFESHRLQLLSTWHCLSTCNHEPRLYTTREAFIQHVVNDHLEGDGNAEELSQLADMREVQKKRNHIKCPFCAEEILENPVTVKLHIGPHFDEIALKALPLHLFDTDSDSDSDSDYIRIPSPSPLPLNGSTGNLVTNQANSERVSEADGGLLGPDLSRYVMPTLYEHESPSLFMDSYVNPNTTPEEPSSLFPIFNDFLMPIAEQYTERRWECSEIGCDRKGERAFSRKDNLRAHMRMVHDVTERRWECSEIGCDRKGERAFFRKDNLRAHMRMVHDVIEPRWECPEIGCDRKGERAFSRRDNLIVHMRNIHDTQIILKRRRVKG